ncbi:hypothetical protein D3C85_867090 [compost metagenome]
MGFRSKMDHCVRLFHLKKFINKSRIGDITLDKPIVRILLNISKIEQITGIS